MNMDATMISVRLPKAVMKILQQLEKQTGMNRSQLLILAVMALEREMRERK